jgi:MSHA biogenesis protein MshN
MDTLRGSLVADAAHEPARQTLVALLVEQRRMDEAVAVLQEGLNLHPANSDFSMLLARILVDRQDVSGALAVLQKYAPAAGTRADYHGFSAALHQRMGQHREAIDEYQTALRLSPQSAVWWVGLGISQEASGRRKEALESFRRARASGSLNGELLAYVDQRLRQLQ